MDQRVHHAGHKEARTGLKNWNPPPGMRAPPDLFQAGKDCSTVMPRSSRCRESRLNRCDLYNEEKEPTYTVQSPWCQGHTSERLSNQKDNTCETISVHTYIRANLYSINYFSHTIRLMCSCENILKDIYCDKLLIFFPESFTYKTSDGSGTLIFGQMHHTI